MDSLEKMHVAVHLRDIHIPELMRDEVNKLKIEDLSFKHAFEKLEDKNRFIHQSLS